MSEEQEDVSRRSFLKYGLGAAGVAAAAALGYYAFRPGAPTEGERQQLNYLGHAFFLPDDAVTEWRGQKEIPVEPTYEDFFVLGQRQLANLGSWDVGASGRHRHLVSADALKPIPADELPRWNPDNLLDIFYNPEDSFSPAQAERFNNLLWADKPDQLMSEPVMWNFDSLTYLPDKVPFEETPGEISISYEEMWNPEWKGRVVGQDEGFTNFTEVANVLDATDQMDISGAISSLTRDEVDQVYNFLLPMIQDGQYRTFWFAYGDIVTLLSTEETWMASTWQPAEFDTRKAGTPAYYAALEHGPFFWFNANFVSKDVPDEKMDEVMEFLNFHLSLFMSMTYTRQGYPTPAKKANDFHDAMGDEFYNWFFNGERTNMPIDEAMEVCWPEDPEKQDLPDRLQHALFTHDIYFRHFWTGDEPRSGSPDPNGGFRDIGSDEYKQEITRYFLSPDLPDNNDYYVEKWEELKANLPA